MSDWEWILTDEGSSKNLNTPAVLSPNDTSYSGRHTYDEEEPVIRYQFEAKAAPKSLRTSVRSLYRARKGQMTISDSLGDSYTGFVTGYGSKHVSGTERFDLSVELTEVITDLDAS